MNQTCSTAGCNGYREPSAQELANRQRDEKAWTAQNQAQNEALDIQRRERERVEREADAQRKPIERANKPPVHIPPCSSKCPKCGHVYCGGYHEHCRSDLGGWEACCANNSCGCAQCKAAITDSREYIGCCLCDIPKNTHYEESFQSWYSRTRNVNMY